MRAMGMSVVMRVTTGMVMTMTMAVVVMVTMITQTTTAAVM